jgi:hypothetical protein
MNLYKIKTNTVKELTKTMEHEPSCEAKIHLSGQKNILLNGSFHTKLMKSSHWTSYRCKTIAYYSIIWPQYQRYVELNIEVVPIDVFRCPVQKIPTGMAINILKISNVS